MLHLLKIEWLKFKNYPTFWILILLITIAIPAGIYMAYDLTDNSFDEKTKQIQSMLLGRPFSFPTIWRTSSWIASMMLFIPSLLIITLTTNEFTYKTHRQNIIDGLKRSQFIMVKIIEVVFLALFITLLVFLTGFIIGKLASGSDNKHSMFEQIYTLGYFFIEAVSYFMLAFLLSLLIKRAGLVLGIFFLYSIIAEQLAREILVRRFNIKLGNFLPLETTDQLILNPFNRLFMTPEALKIWEKTIPAFLTMSAVYFAIYITLSIYTFKTKDL